MSSDQQLADGRDLVEALICAGGRRVDPPAEAYQAVFAAAHATWRDKVDRRRRRWVSVRLAAAAALGLLAVSLFQSPWWQAPAALEVAHIDRIEGLVERRAAGVSGWAALAAADDDVLAGGSRLRTGAASGAGLLYPGQVSLRLGSDSEIELTDLRRVTLRHGTVYVQTGHARSSPLEVNTPYGTVRHVGTQYELHSTALELRIRVREGQVVLERESGQVAARAGEQLSVTTSGAVERRAFATHDPAWGWTESLAPMPPLDGQPARVLLEWAARETGRELHYTDTASERRAAQVVLHGQFGRLSPSQSLEVLRATTDLDCQLDAGGRIIVAAR
ncbi:MAG: hypothetical protein H6R27_2054 [Proteobacteria bacterium]|nr:hypothetical protein [Pseudomonadota bacterium]